MKKFLVVIGLISFIAIVNASCKKADSNQTTFIDSATIAYSSCVDIIRNSNTYNICLDSVWDNRCPADVVCIWGGYVACKFRLNNNGQTYSLKLSSINISGMKSDTTIAGIKIIMKDVNPYPMVSAGYTLKDYRVKIVLSN